VPRIDAPLRAARLEVGCDVIALVGALGVVVGLLAPTRTMEPSIGLLLLCFVARTYLRERRARRAQLR